LLEAQLGLGIKPAGLLGHSVSESPSASNVKVADEEATGGPPLVLPPPAPPRRPEIMPTNHKVQ